MEQRAKQTDAMPLMDKGYATRWRSRGAAVRNYKTLAVSFYTRGANSKSHCRRNAGGRGEEYSGASLRGPMRPGLRGLGPRNDPACRARFVVLFAGAGVLAFASGCNDESRDHLKEAGERLDQAAESLDRAAKESLEEARESVSPSTDR